MKTASCIGCDDMGKLIVRLSIGLLVLLHGIDKIMNGPGGIGSMIAGVGLPEFLAYGVYVGEVLAPLMVIAGFRARAGGLLIAVTLFVAILLAHRGDIFAMNGYGGWAIELQALYLFGGLAIYFLGAGKYAVSKSDKWD